MNIAKILKSLAICYIAILSIGNNTCNAVEIDTDHINNCSVNKMVLNKSSKYYNDINNNIYNNKVVLSDINDARKIQMIIRTLLLNPAFYVDWEKESFKGAVLYLNSNQKRFHIDRCGTAIEIFQNNKYSSTMSNFAMDGKNNYNEQVYKYKNFFDKMNQLCGGKDFITHLREDVKTIFGNDYKAYFNYRNIDYKNQKTITHTFLDENTTFKQTFNGTFDELLKTNELDELVMEIEIDLQFMKKMWINDNRGFSFDMSMDDGLYINDQYLVITNNSTIYYFDIEKNLIKIYSKRHSKHSANGDLNIIVKEFLQKIKERWETEQTLIQGAILKYMREELGGGIYYIPHDDDDSTYYVDKLPKK